MRYNHEQNTLASDAEEILIRGVGVREDSVTIAHVKVNNNQRLYNSSY